MLVFSRKKSDVGAAVPSRACRDYCIRSYQAQLSQEGEINAPQDSTLSLVRPAYGHLRSAICEMCATHISK